MANTCKTCRHDDVEKINKLLANETSLRKIMDNHRGLSTGGLQRHKENCIPDLFAEVREQKRTGLLADIDKVKVEIEATKTKFGDNGMICVQLIGKRLDTIEKEARLTGAFQRDRRNESDIDLTVLAYQKFLADYPNASADERSKWLGWFADGSGIEKAELAKRLRVQEVSEMIQ